MLSLRIKETEWRKILSYYCLPYFSFEDFSLTLRSNSKIIKPIDECQLQAYLKMLYFFLSRHQMRGLSGPTCFRTYRFNRSRPITNFYPELILPSP